MKFILILVLLFLTNPIWALNIVSLDSTSVTIPGGSGGIGFDDMVYSSQLHKVLVPAGHTGKLYLIDPSSLSMTAIDGFSSSPQFQKGHKIGISSVDEGNGYIFVFDHGKHQLDAIDVKTNKIAAFAATDAAIDILRYVPLNHEVWATEPDEKDVKQIEIFTFTSGQKPVLVHSLFIKVPDGPESLTIDISNQKAYTNMEGNVGVFDLMSHTLVGQWPNGCNKSSGTAVDEKRGFLFVACKEGRASIFDLNQNGKALGSLPTGPGADLVYYNPDLSHFYITGGKDASLSILGVSPHGQLFRIGIGKAAMRSHCVVGDDQRNIWVCAPHEGQLLRYKDIFPAVQ